jgi:hypothetical protein
MIGLQYGTLKWRKEQDNLMPKMNARDANGFNNVKALVLWINKKRSEKMKTIIAILLLGIILLTPIAVQADTGTYKITNYTITLDPQPNGTVNTDYEQTWLVTGGGIPWITIGMANPNFNIMSFGENAIQASNASSGGWYGIRLDLDRNYLPNETFKVKLSVNQQGLIEALPDQEKWRLGFTAGWYDNCVIDNMTIKLISHSDPSSYIFTPPPTTQEDNIYYWTQSNVPRGAKATIIIQSTDGTFITENITIPTPIQASNGCGVAGWEFLILLFLLIIGLIIGSIINKHNENKYINENLSDFEKKFPKTDEDELKERIKEKRKIEDDEDTGYVSPMLWIAAHPYSSSTGHFKGFSGGESGGGGSSGSWSGGSGVSCACVSCACACACACAGGGAAGCTNKYNLKNIKKLG